MRRIYIIYAVSLAALLAIAVAGLRLSQLGSTRAQLRKLNRSEREYQEARRNLLLSARNPIFDLFTFVNDRGTSRRARLRALEVLSEMSFQQQTDTLGRYLIPVLSDTSKEIRLAALRVRILKDGSLIGRPFEYRIAHLPYHHSRHVDFVLQRETEDVVVQVAFGDTTVSLPVYLEREAKEDRVLLEAIQFSQEGEPGTRIAYELEAERFVDDDKAFSLSVLSLPPDYTYEFREQDRESNRENSRVSRVRFKKGVTTKGLELIISMPKEIAKSDLNKKITFFVLMMDRFAQQRLADLKSETQGRSLTAEDLDSASISYETLELIPRGRAEITITASKFSTKVKMDEMIGYSFTLHNSGTVNLDRVRVELGLPLDWSAGITPEKNIDLEVGAKQKVDVEIIPAVDVVAGDYEVTLNASTLHEGRDVEASPKIMRIQIEGKSNFIVGAILMLVLVGMIVGVAVMTIKVSRR